MNRREFLKNAAAGNSTLSLQSSLTWSALAGTGSTTLSIVRRTIEVNGRAASVFGLQRPDGKPGLRLRAGRCLQRGPPQ